EPQAREYCFAYTLGRRDPHTGVQKHGALRTASPECPGAAAATYVIHNCRAGAEIRRCFWCTMLFEVRGRAHDPLRTLRDFSRNQRRVRESPHAERDVDPVFDQIDVAVLENE